MELKNYNLKIGQKTLLCDVNVSFDSGIVNHVLGKNGVGKSLFAKDLVLANNNITLISSYSNIPMDITFRDVLLFLNKNFGENRVSNLCTLLNTQNIIPTLVIKKLSDGQKQKIKLLVYLLLSNDIIIFDEITNALDKTTVNEIYAFINNYICTHPEKIIVNITHNLSDLKQIKGQCYIFDNQKIDRVETEDAAIALYLGI